jgi:prepilin-type N-terminal cleavage/methylation domain-containing protein
LNFSINESCGATRRRSINPATSSEESALMSGDFRRVIQRRAGFTLLELVVVLVIMGIVATFAAPRIDLNRFRVNSAYQAVAMTLLSAQRIAIRKQHAIVVAIDTAGKRLRIHEDRDNDGVIDSGERIDFLQLEEAIVFGRGVAPARPMGNEPVSFVKQQGGLPAVTFTRSGSAGEMGGFYLTSIRAARGGNFPEDTRAYEVERATGRATVFRFTNGSWVRSF